MVFVGENERDVRGEAWIRRRWKGVGGGVMAVTVEFGEARR